MSGRHVAHQPRGRRRLLSSLVAAAVLGAGLVAASTASQAAADDVTITGHGWGHGRGMGQYGALGYAVNYGWTWQQIVSHYYQPATIGDAANSPISAELSAQTGLDTIVTGPGLLVNGQSVGAPAILVRRNGTTLDVYAGAGCGGTAGTWGAPVMAGLVSGVAVTSTADTTQLVNQLRLCDASGSKGYRGTYRVVVAGGTQYTWNELPVEDYLKGVVPRESPSSWGSLGGGRGQQALMAQAVAARGYVLSGSKSASGATTCDTTACQVYGGSTTWSTDGVMTSQLEASLSNQAVDATVGKVMKLGAAIARTQFSSSTGGYTAGGTFAAVQDDGDAIAGNTNHNWSVTLSRASIAAALGTGPISSIDVTARNGLGADGGRATSVVVTATNGTKTTFTGNTVRIKLGLKSDWFSFVGQGPVQTCAGGAGYWMTASDGGVFAFCGAGYYGSAGAVHLASPIVAMASSASGHGYWLVASDGGVFAYGDAGFYGSTGAIKLNRPIVDILPTKSGAGYWLIASDGGVFAFGDAGFLGSTGGIKLNKPIVTSARTPSGTGYWLIASDGGVFSFGDAGFYGSTGAMKLNQPIVSVVAPATGGYGLVASDGGYFAFPPASFYGSTGGIKLNKPIVTAAMTSSGAGYWMFASDGGVFSFGDAQFLGSLGAIKLNAPIVDAAVPTS